MSRDNEALDRALSSIEDDAATTRLRKHVPKDRHPRGFMLSIGIAPEDEGESAGGEDAAESSLVEGSADGDPMNGEIDSDAHEMSQVEGEEDGDVISYRGRGRR